MFFKQYYLGCLAHASYMIGDEATKTAVVVDPQRDIDQYAKDAKEHGYHIRHVILTHFHADFVAGHLELRNRFGATIHLGRRAEAEYEFVPLKDGDELTLGNVKFEFLETPGHTPEGVSVLVYDMSKDNEKPHAVLTGDTLFIGDVGRPDLMASVGVTADELAGMLYHSLREKLLTLPDDTLVYPAHGAGSLCGKNLSDETVSTIGEQRKYNYALQPMGRDEFVQLVTADLQDAPDYFGYDAVMNQKEHATLDVSMAEALKPLALDEVLALAEGGAQLVDARDAADFAGAHLKHSINIALDGKYAPWSGALLDRERPIVIVAESDRVEVAAMRLGRIGFDHVAGYLDGGMQTLETRPDLVGQVERISARRLVEELESPARPVVLDVRTEKEHAAGHIEGSLNIPLNELERRVEEVPRDKVIVVHCAGGYRSSIATSMLLRAGVTRVHDLVGGFAAWKKSASPQPATDDGN